jgi:hypothetical protein
MDYFSDDDTSTVIGGLSIENGKAGVLIHGSTVIGRDRQSLADLVALRAEIDGLILVLGRSSADLADTKKAAEAADLDLDFVDNPF